MWSTNRTKCDEKNFPTHSGYWKSYEDRDFEGLHPCEQQFNPCCHYWSIKFGQNLEAIMLIMKYSQLHGKTTSGDTEYEADFGRYSDRMAHLLNDSTWKKELPSGSSGKQLVKCIIIQ